jgi:glutamate dehydrogenase (NAD(P)+)
MFGPAAVFDNISTKLRTSTHETLQGSRQQGVTTHRVGRAAAQARVAEAMGLRGRLPKSFHESGDERI